jgi:hypothetical protein
MVRSAASQQWTFEQSVRSADFVGVQIRGQVPDPVSFSEWGNEIAVAAPGSAFVERLLTAGRTGGVLFLTRYGERLAAVVPADVAESLLDQPLEGIEGTVAGTWAAWQQAVTRSGQGSLLQRGVAAGEIEPPTEWGIPDLIPELADLPSLADSLIAARERERGE